MITPRNTRPSLHFLSLPLPLSRSAPLLQKVLVAEDDKVNRFLIRKILEKRGLAVTLAEGGEECVRLFEQAQAQAEGGGGGGVFDIVVTDLNMVRRGAAAGPDTAWWA